VLDLTEPYKWVLASQLVRGLAKPRAAARFRFGSCYPAHSA
jgi:hypothetical protein